MTLHYLIMLPLVSLSLPWGTEKSQLTECTYPTGILEDFTFFLIVCFPAENQDSQVPSKRFLSPWGLTVTLWRGHDLGLSRCKVDYTPGNWGSVWILVGMDQKKTMLYNLILTDQTTTCFICLLMCFQSRLAQDSQMNRYLGLIN